MSNLTDVCQQLNSCSEEVSGFRSDPCFARSDSHSKSAENSKDPPNPLPVTTACIRAPESPHSPRSSRFLVVREWHPTCLNVTEQRSLYEW